MVNKIVCLFHPRFHQKNLIDTIQIFLNNGYPLSLIFSIINNRIKYHIHNYNFTHKISTKHKEKFFLC